MGSPTISNSKPETAIMEKKSIKDRIIKPIQALFINKKKDKTKKELKTNDIADDFEKLQINNENTKAETKLTENDEKLTIKNETNVKKEQEEDEELKNFKVKVIEDDKVKEEDRRAERIDSHSSEDSGFSEPVVTEKDEEIIESLQNLKIEGNEKKLATVVVKRGHERVNLDYTPSTHPYKVKQNAYSQINQVNKHTFSGGHVTVATRKPAYFAEVDIAFKKVEQNAPHYSLNTPQAQEDYLNLVQEYIDKENSEPKDSDDILADFVRDVCDDSQELQNFVQNEISKMAEPNPIEEFTNQINYEEYPNLESIINLEDEVLSENCNSIFPTPPRESTFSPMSDSQSYPASSEYQLSPPLSSPMANDYECCQDITQLEDSLPTVVTQETEKKFERNMSTSSMTMKQYKDKQKELSMDFSKRECCLIRKSCKEIFEEHMRKLKKEERFGLCLKVANLDLKTAFGVLQHILLSLSHESEQEDLQYALFALICDRVLANQASLFAQDFGLSLIKSAAMRCPHRPILTRRLRQCVYTALKEDPTLSEGKDCLFREIDAQGDNLVLACARAGDSHAAVLAELVRTEDSAPPLFGIHHHNAEGYSALHVACRLHSERNPHLHVIHALLEHGGADLWRGDVKGGDTSLHLAVNSPTCDLNLVLMLFKHVDRKEWKKLAHVHNRSSVTPLEYARCATKSTTRQNYPPEVLEFLKKCR